MSTSSLVLASWIFLAASPWAQAAEGAVVADPGLVELKSNAEKGDATSQVNLGVLYANGQNVEKDYEEAVKWFLRAAGQGHVMAQFNLGIVYANGQGVEKDPAESLKWYRKAADQGLAAAQFTCGSLYDAGLGTKKDPAEAVTWYRKAADQGHAMAQFNLGAAYNNGEGVAKDLVEAYAWINLAVRSMAEKASFRDDLEKAMSSQQVTAAQRRTKALKSQIESKANEPKPGAPKASGK